MYLKLTYNKELLKVGQGQQRMIAANVNKTGYAKIAQLVEMPLSADMT